jgi:hypothetical protein
MLLARTGTFASKVATPSATITGAIAGANRRTAGNLAVFVGDQVQIAGANRRTDGAIALSVPDAIRIAGANRRTDGGVVVYQVPAIVVAGANRRTAGSVAIQQVASINMLGANRRTSGSFLIAPPSESEFDPETETLLNAFSGSYSGAREDAINDLIAGLKADGDWDKFIGLYIVGANTADSFINWKTPGTFNATNNGLTVTANTQYVGNGVNQYADTGINPNTHLSTNSAGLMCGVLSIGNGLSFMGSRTESEFFDITRVNFFNRMNVGINQGTPNQANSVTDGTGLWVASRTGSAAANMFLRRNGSSVGFTSTFASGNRPNFNIWLGAENRSGTIEGPSTNTYWMFAVLSTGPTTSEADDMRSRLATYQSALTL